MAGRRNPPEANRRQHHAAQVAKASTRKQQLLAMAYWLAALAADLGPAEVDTAVAAVWGQITQFDPHAETALEVAQR